MDHPSPAATTSEPASPRILWAEDNAQDRMLIEESLSGIPALGDLTLVADGVHVMEALPTAQPAFLVLDLKMPRLGGLETLRLIRANPAWKHIPVMVFSSGNRPEEVEQCLALGAVEVVQKPVGFDQFSAAVQRIVAQAGRSPPIVGAIP